MNVPFDTIKRKGVSEKKEGIRRSRSRSRSGKDEIRVEKWI
jgi:hypothetical protein